jgi:hypothetical protein
MQLNNLPMQTRSHVITPQHAGSSSMTSLLILKPARQPQNIHAV